MTAFCVKLGRTGRGKTNSAVGGDEGLVGFLRRAQKSRVLPPAESITSLSRVVARPRDLAPQMACGSVVVGPKAGRCTC